MRKSRKAPVRRVARSEYLHVKLRPDELAVLHEAAALEDRTTSEWVRALVLPKARQALGAK